MAKYIRSINISQKQLGAIAENRKFVITGDIDANCMLQVVSSDSPSKFYNFTKQTFETTFNSQHNLKINLESNKYYGSILFPAAGGVDYKVMLFQDPIDKETIIKESAVSKESLFISKTIEGLADTAITFSLHTANTSNYATLPSDIVSTGNITTSGSVAVDIEKTVENIANDTHGFGLKHVSHSRGITSGKEYNQDILKDQVWQQYLFYQKTTDVNGSTSSQTYVVVDDITNLGVGMELTYKTGTTAPDSAATITAIDTDTKTITISAANSLTDGNTLTFRGYGIDIIQDIHSCILAVSSLGISCPPLSKSVRADGSLTEATDGSSTNIALVGTYGIAGGNTVAYSGVGVDNTSANKVSTVATASSTLGHITVQNAQNLVAGTLLAFTGCFASATLTSSLEISKYPSSSFELQLDLDKIFTPGAAS